MRSIATPIKVTGSEEVTPKSKLFTNCVIAADPQEVESFFGNFVPRSRVRESVNALQAARELDFIRVGNRSLIQIAQPKATVNRVGTGTPARPGRA